MEFKDKIMDFAWNIHQKWQLITFCIVFQRFSCSIIHVNAVISTRITSHDYQIKDIKVFRRSTDECNARSIPSNFVCEQQAFDLACNAGELIAVNTALYGRLIGSSRCPGPIHTTNCRQGDSLNVVSQRCNGRQTCRVAATNNVFGDPCQGTFKYLEIQYSCEDACCPKCQNGGTCTGTNVCQCQPGYVGEGCQTLTNTCPSDITIPVQPGRNGTTVNWNRITDTNVNVSSTHDSGEFFNIGNTTVTYHVENDTVSASCSFTVLVLDRDPPSIKCPSDYDGFVFTNATNAIVSWLNISASDNSGSSTHIICSEENGAMFPIGTTEVKCVAYDPSGNNDTCSFQVHIKAICPAIKTNSGIGLLSWPQTVAGMTVESNERCPVNSERRNFGLATRECVSNVTYGAVWHNEMVHSCGDMVIPEVEELAVTIVTEDNVKEVAETLASIIEASPTLGPEEIDINAVQETFTNIVNVGSPSVEVTEVVVEVVDRILSTNTSMEESQNYANASSMILKSFEEQISLTLEEHGQFKAAQPNIVVEAITLNRTQAKDGLRLSASHNMGIQKHTSNESSFEGEVGSSNPTSSIFLPSDVLLKTGNETKVSFISYNEDNLFQSQVLSTSYSSMVISGPIISAVVLGKHITNSTTPVVVQIFPTKVDRAVLNSSVCVFWDFNLNDGIGDWAQDGCELVSIGPEGTTCHCNHLTNFAVLVDFAGQALTPTTFDFALGIISKIGCTLSIASLCFTLVIFLTSRRLRKTLPRKILIQFCIAMLCLYLIFLVGIDSQSRIGCMVIAGLLHYFVLATIFWMAAEARHMYMSLVSVFDIAGSRFMLKAACFAWGLPFIPVAVVLGVKQKHYFANSYCFLAPGYGLYFGLLLPVATVILYNTITFIMVMRRLLKSNLGGNVDNKANIKKVGRRLRNAFTISVLLGLTWVFGFLAINRARMVFQLLFCIANSFQGVLVFVLLCLNQEDVRKVLMGTCFESHGGSKGQKKFNRYSGKRGKSASNASSSNYSVGYLQSMSYSAEDKTATFKSNKYDAPQMDYVDNDYEDINNQKNSTRVNIRFAGDSPRQLELIPNEMHAYASIN